MDKKDIHRIKHERQFAFEINQFERSWKLEAGSWKLEVGSWKLFCIRIVSADAGMYGELISYAWIIAHHNLAQRRRGCRGSQLDDSYSKCSPALVCVV